MLEEIEHLMRFTRCPNETVFTIELPERCKEDFQEWKKSTLDECGRFYVSLDGKELSEENKKEMEERVTKFYFPETGFINVKFYKENESPIPYKV